MFALFVIGLLSSSHEMIVAFVAQEPNSAFIEPIGMASHNAEVADRAVFVIPHAINQIEFFLVVFATLVWLPHAVAIDQFLLHQGRVGMKYRLAEFLIKGLFPRSPIVGIISVDSWVAGPVSHIHRHVLSTVPFAVV